MEWVLNMLMGIPLGELADLGTTIVVVIIFLRYIRWRDQIELPGADPGRFPMPPKFRNVVVAYAAVISVFAVAQWFIATQKISIIEADRNNIEAAASQVITEILEEFNATDTAPAPSGNGAGLLPDSPPPPRTDALQHHDPGPLRQHEWAPQRELSRP